MNGRPDVPIAHIVVCLPVSSVNRAACFAVTRRPCRSVKYSSRIAAAISFAHISSVRSGEPSITLIDKPMQRWCAFQQAIVSSAHIFLHHVFQLLSAIHDSPSRCSWGIPPSVSEISPCNDILTRTSKSRLCEYGISPSVLELAYDIPGVLLIWLQNLIFEFRI